MSLSRQQRCTSQRADGPSRSVQPFPVQRARPTSGLTPKSTKLAANTEHSETSPLIGYDEYYTGECLPSERELGVRDLSWPELAQIDTFRLEDRTSFNQYMKELVALVPDLGGRLRCLRLEVLQAIWRDDAIPCKLVDLKLQFSEVDISLLVSRRPSILIDANFEAVPEATAYLQQYINPAELNRLVEVHPWFLAAHLDEYLAGYSTVLDVGPREALRGIMRDPGGIGFDYCYGRAYGNFRYH